MKRIHIVNRRRFISSVSMVIFAITLLLSFVASNIESSADAPVYWTETVVQEGDTLWHLADQVASEEQDIRCVIDSIIRYNHLESPDIRPGQQLWLPENQRNLVAEN